MSVRVGVGLRVMPCDGRGRQLWQAGVAGWRGPCLASKASKLARVLR